MGRSITKKNFGVLALKWISYGLLKFLNSEVVLGKWLSYEYFCTFLYSPNLLLFKVRKFGQYYTLSWLYSRNFFFVCFLEVWTINPFLLTHPTRVIIKSKVVFAKLRSLNKDNMGTSFILVYRYVGNIPFVSLILWR